MMIWRLLVILTSLSACTVIRTPSHPTVQNAPASSEDTEASRLGTLLRVAAQELSCPQVEVVLTFSRDYANTAQPSHVVDGCGKRAVYAEACGDYPRCRYLLISLLTLPNASHTTSSPP